MYVSPDILALENGDTL